MTDDLCLIDLHLHLDGSLSAASVRHLARMQGIALPAEDDALHRLLSVSPGCRDLNEYLTKFDFPCSLLQTEDALSFAVRQLMDELQSQGLRYAEIRFAPQKHCLRGLSQDAAVQAAINGLRRAALPGNLILCCMRGGSDADNRETVRVAGRYREVCAVDLAGAEALYPTGYGHLFALAAGEGLRCTVHAGEALGPESIRRALEWGASRIGHGVRAVEDPQLMALLAERNIPLELCPTSNLNTAVFAELADYPLLRLIEAGIPVTVNTDNLTVSDTTLRREYALLADTFRLTPAQLLTLQENAVRASFADDRTRAMLLDTLRSVGSAAGDDMIC